MSDIILTTTETIAGYEIVEVLGLVQGSCVQSKSFGKDFGAGLKNLVGGELRAYTDMMDESRQMSTKRMVDKAHNMGADAIVAIRYSAANVVQGASETMAVGTAVKIQRK